MFSFIVVVLAIIGLSRFIPPLSVSFYESEPEDTSFTYWVDGVEYPIAESGEIHQEFTYQSSLFESEDILEGKQQ